MMALLLPLAVTWLGKALTEPAAAAGPEKRCCAVSLMTKPSVSSVAVKVSACVTRVRTLNSTAPLATLLSALVVFSVGQLTLGLVNKQSSLVEQAILSQGDDYRTLSNAQEQIAQIHTGVYRHLGLIASMDAAQIKQLRADMAQQLVGFKRVVQGASSISERDAKSLQLSLIHI